MSPTLVAVLFGSALVTTTATAHAGVEIGGTVGAHIFNDDNELGVKDFPQAPSQRNSVLLGLRVGVFFADVIGVEGELAAIPTVARDYDYSITDLTFRGHLIAQFRARDPENHFIPFVLVGGGGFTVVQTNNGGRTDKPKENIGEDTDAAFYVGVGFKYRVSPRWGLRLDGRLLLVPSSENDNPPKEDVKKVTTDFEAMASAYVSFGGTEKVVVKEVVPPADDDPDHDGIRGAADQCPTDPEDKDGFQDEDGCSEPDNDGDGILDANDKCPTDAEDKDGFQDDDGCPDPDNDGDGLNDNQDKCPAEPEDKDNFQDDDGCPDLDNDGDGLNDNQDKCPAEPEDKDNFQDDDGCPDLDNDGDGVLDAQDKCIDKPETKNGYQDDDGCPDEIPEKVKKFTGVVQGINFRTADATLLATSNKTLDKAVAVLKEFPELKLEIQGHTDDVPLKAKKGGKYADNLELSQARAESVRAYFIKKGITEDRLSAKGYGDANPVVPIEGLKGSKLTTARSKNRRVEFQLVSPLK